MRCFSLSLRALCDAMSTQTWKIVGGANVHVLTQNRTSKWVKKTSPFKKKINAIYTNWSKKQMGEGVKIRKWWPFTRGRYQWPEIVSRKCYVSHRPQAVRCVEQVRCAARARLASVQSKANSLLVLWLSIALNVPENATSVCTCSNIVLNIFW